MSEHSRARSDRLRIARSKGKHTPEEWAALKDACGIRCAKCKDSGEWNLVRDHIVPIHAGGSDAIDNIQPLCQRCNSAKGPDQTDYRPENWKFLLPAFLETGEE